MKQDENQNIRVGITHGDFNGISYEIIIKTFLDKRSLELFTPIVYGSSKIASYYRKSLDLTEVNFNLVKKADYANAKRVNIINCFNEEVKIETGQSSEVAGEMAFVALEKAVDDLKWDKIDVLVTAPFNKKSIQSEKFNFAGHTDYLASKFETDEHLMLMVNRDLRIGILTGHIPLKEVSTVINKELVVKKLSVFNKSLQKDFNIRKPRIAVLGLNPHAGDQGLIGSEEIDVLNPAIEQVKGDGILAFGPYPADGFFGSANYTHFDGIMAMYHDQGMLPFKTFAFDTGVNFTAGLPIVRTSPAHGTAYDIAGKNQASPDSLRQAIYLAIDVFRNRKAYEALHDNPLSPSPENKEPATTMTGNGKEAGNDNQ